MKWSDEMVAAHELGHAIVAQETGLTPGNIRVERSWWSNEIVSGYCELGSFMYPVPGDNPEPGGWDLFRGMLIMTAAGQAASAHWFRLNDQPVEFTADHDYAAFRKDAQLMPNAPSWEQALEEATHLVVARWDDVVENTPVLLEKHRVDGSKV